MGKITTADLRNTLVLLLRKSQGYNLLADEADAFFEQLDRYIEQKVLEGIREHVGETLEDFSDPRENIWGKEDE